jgi:hypothetical protein
MLKSILICALFCLAGCYQHHLFVLQEWVDGDMLASAKVGTPDPRSEDPPVGQKLLIAWSFPTGMFDQGLTMRVDMRLWSNEEQTILIPVERLKGTTSLFFPCPDQILTYRIQVVAADGSVVENWEHQFWTPLVTSSSVSSKPKQGSVIDTP